MIIASAADGLKTLAPSADAATTQSSATVTIARECTSYADDLVRELSQLKVGKTSRRPWKAVSRTAKMMTKKPAIQALEANLNRCRGYLDTAVLAELRSALSKVVDSLPNMKQDTQRLVVSVEQGLSSLSLALQGQEQALDRAINRILAQERIKNSLFYPDIYARRDRITEEHRQTCEWIFRLPNSIENDAAGVHDQQASHASSPSAVGFLDWLRSGSGFYWISGKPGSGKSTLMKYLIQNGQTHEALQQWSSEYLVLSHFFWNPGSPLQHNTEGMLRSLLYQILDHRRDLVSVIADDPSQSLRIHTWTVSRLQTAMRLALSQMPTNLRACLFVDGLDEVCDDQDELLSTIDLFAEFDCLKCCLACRPEQLYLTRFRNSPRITVQDLNHQDIRQTLDDRLRPKLVEHHGHEPLKIEQLLDYVESRTQGVFLWLKLMVSDLCVGCSNADTMDELHIRVEMMPEELSAMYRRMLEKQLVPTSCTSVESANLYFQAPHI